MASKSELIVSDKKKDGLSITFCLRSISIKLVPTLNQFNTAFAVTFANAVINPE